MRPTWHRKTRHKMDDAMEGQVALGMRNITAILSCLLSRLLRSFPSIGFLCLSYEVRSRSQNQQKKNSQSHQKNMNRNRRCRLDVDFKESGGQSLHSWIMIKNGGNFLDLNAKALFQKFFFKK